MKILATVATLAVLAVVGTIIYAYTGIYDVAATRQHTAPVYWLLQTALTRSVQVRASDIEVPDLTDPARIQAGLHHYEEYCTQCHGAPGIAPAQYAQGMTPVPPPMVQLGREISPGEIFWSVKHGIKMTGMPSWAFKLADEEIWNIVAFALFMPELSPVEFYDMAGRERPQAAGTLDPVELAEEPGDPEVGKVAIRQYGCIACHTVQGVTGPDAWVGPPLRNIAERGYLGGVIPNTSENLIRWIRDPQGIDPLTAMPSLGVEEGHARDIAAYLYSLDG